MNKQYRLIVQSKDYHCNIPITSWRLDGDVVFAFKDGAFVAMFDLGGIDALWISEKEGGA